MFDDSDDQSQLTDVVNTSSEEEDDEQSQEKDLTIPKQSFGAHPFVFCRSVEGFPNISFTTNGREQNDPGQ